MMLYSLQSSFVFIPICRPSPSFCCFIFFFFNDTATTEIYTLSLHDALPISCRASSPRPWSCSAPSHEMRSEEHTSELQSRFDLVCRLLLEKKNKHILETILQKKKKKKRHSKLITKNS